MSLAKAHPRSCQCERCALGRELDARAKTLGPLRERPSADDEQCELCDAWCPKGTREKNLGGAWCCPAHFPKVAS